uniref:Uncharacterized protein n=1 Tax=Rhizophora mucronata TaxID=61149 RepID=A0A2P2QZG4_RHIMU
MLNNRLNQKEELQLPAILPSKRLQMD